MSSFSKTVSPNLFVLVFPLHSLRSPRTQSLSQVLLNVNMRAVGLTSDDVRLFFGQVVAQPLVPFGHLQLVGADLHLL